MQNQKISWLTGNIHILEITMLGMRHTIDSTSIPGSEPFEGGTFSRYPHRWIQVSTATVRETRGAVQVSESLQQSPNLVHCFAGSNEKLHKSSSLMKAYIHSWYCSCYFDASSSNEFQFDIPDQQVLLIRYIVPILTANFVIFFRNPISKRLKRQMWSFVFEGTFFY